MIRQELLDVFWKTHDPTTLDRQGPDTDLWYLRTDEKLVPSKNAKSIPPSDYQDKHPQSNEFLLECIRK